MLEIQRSFNTVSHEGNTDPTTKPSMETADEYMEIERYLAEVNKSLVME